MGNSSELLKAMLEMLTKTHEEELTCDEAFELLDQFVEAVARGEDVSALMPKMEQHLKLCRDCYEEFQALLRVIEAELHLE
jgi:hypothetical protein